MDTSEQVLGIQRLIEAQGSAWEKHNAAEAVWKKSVEGDLTRLNRGHAFGGSDSTANPVQVKAFFDYVRTGRESPELKSMSAGSSPAGGYLIPEEIDALITKYLRAASPMRQICRVVPVTSLEFTELHSPLGTVATWIGETAARPETTAPTWRKVSIPSCEVYSNPAISQTLLDDAAFDLQGWLVEELGDAFAAAESDAFINGNGVGRPRGLFTYSTAATSDSTRADSDYEHVVTGANGAFHTTGADPLISLVFATKPAYRQNASWLMSPEVLSAVRKMKASLTGEFLWEPSLQPGQPSRLLGYPVFEDENLPALATGSLSVAFGDFQRAYTITDRKSALLVDPYTNKPFVHLYASKRVGGGGGRDTRAVKFLKFAA
jgi:HK97 family phage major capsid protein